MGKRHIVAILVVIFVYAAIIIWYQEGSEIFQKFFSKQGQVVTFDQQSYHEYDEYSYDEQTLETRSASPEDVFNPGNFADDEEAPEFAKVLEDLAVNEITKNIQPIMKQVSGGNIAQLFYRGRQEFVNDLFASATLESNRMSSSLEGKLVEYHKWLLKTP